MQTFTGRQFYPLDPRPEHIDIIDIAHSLSMQCRYNGHIHRFYSVAEHCVLASQNVAPENALWALLHDATEAYVGDMVRPLKINMPEYRHAEDKVMLAIAERFGISLTMPDEVHSVDRRLLLDERAALMGPPAGDWRIEGDPLGIEIHAWQPDTARTRYLERFAELTDTSVCVTATDAAIRPTSIPVPLQEYIDTTIGHDDYAPYVLDGQSAELTGDADDWHDALVTVDGPRGISVTKFTMRPDGALEHFVLAG